MILVQEITTIWSKQSRGGPLAAARKCGARNLSACLRTYAPTAGGLPAHTIAFGEATDFAHPREQVMSYTLTEELRFGCVSITPIGDQVQVIYTYDMGCGGAPQRYGLPQLAFTLHQNEWGQILYNGHFLEEYTWTYRKHVCNIGVFEQVEAEVFVRRPPKHCHD
jgi:hypothetical protein